MKKTLLIFLALITCSAEIYAQKCVTSSFTAEQKALMEKDGIKPKVTMWAVRAAITGRTCGADMVGILEILGKETSLYRAEKAIKVSV